MAQKNWRVCKQCKWRYNHALKMTYTIDFCSQTCEHKYLQENSTLPAVIKRREYFRRYRRDIRA